MDSLECFLYDSWYCHSSMTDHAPHHTGAKSHKKGGCRGCMRGCLWFLLAILVIAAILTGLIFRVPQKLGLMRSPAEKVFTQTPDREGAKKMLNEAKAAGLVTKGISLYVLPVGDGSKSIALATLDVREGFTFGQTQGLDPIAGIMTRLMAGPTVSALGVERLAISYVGETGATFGTFTASTDAIRAVAAGRMTKEQFLTAVDGDINLPAVVKYQLDALSKLQ